ncbi:MAG: hypothetical protein KF824_05350 [Fimbriimonadaceae bacterium]|nr:MAG: hypothetical protein KF824_05350 [Fimbriimonadaceae bacterium]
MSELIRIENVCPVLGVSSLGAARKFYIDLLGFEVAWGFEEGAFIGSLQRDGKGIMFSTSEKSGMTCWIGVEDIVLIYEALTKANATIVQEPTNQPWAYEFRALDYDGNILWFGSNPLA